MEKPNQKLLSHGSELTNMSEDKINNISQKKRLYSSDKILSLEKLLFQIMTKFTGLPGNDIEREIKETLKIVVDNLDFDRGTLFDYIEDEDLLKVRIFYAQPNIPSPSNRKNSQALIEYKQQMKNGNVMFFPGSDSTSEKYDKEKAPAKATKIKSNIRLPIKIGDKITGALVFDIYREEIIWSKDLINDLEILTEIFSNTLTLKRFYNKQEYRLELEGLISSISTRFLNIPVDNIDKEIEIALKRIVLYLGVDRSTLIQIDESASDGYRLTHMWWRIKGDSIKNDLSDISFPWILQKLKKDGFYFFSNIDEIPETAEIDKRSLMSTRVRSAMTVPLVVDNRMEGFLVFDTTESEKHWSPDIISSAKMIAQIFANILSRKKTDTELKNAYKKIQELKERTENENIYLRKEIELQNQHKEIIGNSHAIRDILDQARRVAKTDSIVLILGETGTGKGLLAQEIHRSSLRKDRPMIKVNCAALPGSLLESELFGYEKGAFTGAITRKLGRFEIASGSTIFLDEIGEIPLDFQAKFLRVIHEGEFERIGGTQTIKVDCRIITATNRDLFEEANKGTFRQDLYYRLKVFPIWIPPLRDRVEDIVELTIKFVDEFSKKMGKKIERIPRQTIALLKGYAWPGNIRELRHLIEQAMILSDGSILNIKLPQHNQREIAAIDSMEENDRKYIMKVLYKTKWQVKGKMGAAEILKMHPATLFSKMKKLGITRPTFASKDP